MPLKVLDVSHYQKVFDWRKLAAGGLDAIVCKATDGLNHPDPSFNYKMVPAQDGIKIPTGAYHFFRPLSDPAEQAESFSDACYKFSPLLMALDLEYMSTGPGVHEDWTDLDDELCAEVIKAFFQELGRTFTGRFGIYTTKSFADQFLTKLDLSPYWLWLADYNLLASAPRTPAAAPRWDMWQRTPRSLQPGVAGDVDLDIFQGDLTALEALACSKI